MCHKCMHFLSKKGDADKALLMWLLSQKFMLQGMLDAATVLRICKATGLSAGGMQQARPMTSSQHLLQVPPSCLSSANYTRPSQKGFQ